MSQELFITQLAAYTAPEIVEQKNKDWVNYGKDNSYFKELINLYENSTTNNSIINGVNNMVYGRGLAALDASSKPEEYAQLMTILKKEDLRRFIMDYKLLGMAAFQIVYKNSKVSQILHFPMECLRAEKCNEDGDVEGWYYSNNWQGLKPSEKPERITAFGYGNKKNNEMFVCKPYSVGRYYYSPPDYVGGLPYAKLEDEIGDYLINDCLNNFSGTKVVNFNNGVPTPEKMQDIKTEVLGKLTGSRGEKVIVAFNSNSDSKTTIDDVPLNDAPQHYEYLSNECFKKLIVAHRVTSPMLLGIREGNDSMGNNAEEIQTATLLFDNIVIKVYQDQIIDCIDKILAVNDIALNLYFKTLKPLSFTDTDQLEGKDNEVIEEETGVELTCLSNEQENDTEIASSLINLGEDFPDSAWELIDEADVDYDIEDGLDDLMVELNTKPKSLLNKIWNFAVSTGSPFPNSPGKQDKEKNGEYFRTRYYYSPKSYNSETARSFCKAMVNANKIYRKQDIIQMGKQTVNPGWGPNGANRYSIWFWKGGGNCHHSWRRLTFKSDSAKINVKSTIDLITTRRARQDGYKVINERKVSQKPMNMPNHGFLPGNPQGQY
tara:strand:+ start:13071 stop:14879 length:1809 start_codon:yes stop_codon:yes gene_type:complete